MSLAIIILAAGQGTRMRSSKPKVLHHLAHKPLLAHVLDTARQLAPQSLFVVYGHGGRQVCEAFPGDAIHWVEQSEQLGTGHAVMQAMPHLGDVEQALILYGDVPLLSAGTLKTMLAQPVQGIHLLTVKLDNPKGYGRIVRNGQNQVQAIVEEKDADDATRRIGEVNTGILCAPTAKLRDWLNKLENHNAQGEYYLTDIIAMAVADGLPVETCQPETIDEVMGVNDQAQRAELERFYQRQQAEKLLRGGVKLTDPTRLDIRGQVTCGQDVEIDINVILSGVVTIADNVRIGAGCIIHNAEIGAGVEILPYSVIEDAKIGANSRVGPFARLRPDTELSEDTHIGNFVEIKKSQVGKGSKINHLSYVGDSEVGRNVNIGAGTITCNYDGANKHKTIIGDDVFVGSDTQLVAPVTVGDGATIGAGATITRDVETGHLALSRVKQQSIKSWKRPRKEQKKEQK